MRSLVTSQSRMPSLEPSTARANRPRSRAAPLPARLRSVMSKVEPRHAVRPAVGVAEALAAAGDPAPRRWPDRRRGTRRAGAASAQPGEGRPHAACVRGRRHASARVPSIRCASPVARPRRRSAGAAAATRTTRRSSRSRPSAPRRSRSSRSRSAPPTTAAPPRRGAARRCRPPSRPCGRARPGRRGRTARARAPSGTGRRRGARGSRLRRPGSRPPGARGCARRAAAPDSSTAVQPGRKRA